jgi:hypothetical protein
LGGLCAADGENLGAVDPKASGAEEEEVLGDPRGAEGGTATCPLLLGPSPNNPNNLSVTGALLTRS